MKFKRKKEKVNFDLKNSSQKHHFKILKSIANTSSKVDNK